MNQEKVLTYRNTVVYLASVLLFSVLVCAGLAGCASVETDEMGGPEQLYQKAMLEKDRGEYKRSADLLGKIEADFPYWRGAPAATLAAAQMYYQSNHFDDAIALAERYVALHPGMRNETEEARYLIFQSYFQGISLPGRDARASEKALVASENYLHRFPNGRWAKKVREGKAFVLEALASKEMIVGRYYLSVNGYIPAMMRFGSVVKNYPTTSQVHEALARLVEIYVTVGLYREAQKTASMLALNAPDSFWYARAYEVLKERHLLKPIERAVGIEKPFPEKAGRFN